MVVACEKCDTRFHLDDSRVPAKGARVRCSRCKHSFFIRPPGTRDEDAIEEVVAEVTEPGGMPVPDVAHDLPDRREAQPEGQRSPRSAQHRAEEEGRGELEEDWQFNEDSPLAIQGEVGCELPGIGELDRSALELAPAPPEPEIAMAGENEIGAPEPDSPVTERAQIDLLESIRARDAQEDSSGLDDLGRPEDWNFVSSGQLELGAEESVPEARIPEFAENRTTSPAPLLEESPAAASATQQEIDETPLLGRLSGLASVVGWILVVSVFAVGLSASLTPPGEGAEVHSGAEEVSIPGLAISVGQVEARIVENAQVGDLLVVSGTLENRGAFSLIPGRALQVQLVAAGQEPIPGATALAGRALAEGWLREQDPEILRRELDSSAAELAHQPMRPGERLRFDAVFEAVPELAVGWLLEAVAVAPPPQPMNSHPPTTPPSSE